MDSVVTALFQRGAMADLEAVSLWDRFANSCVSYFRYISKLFVPVKLAVIYPFTGWPIWLVVLCAAGLIGVSWLAIRARKQKPYLPVGWFWFLGTLVPVIGLVQVGVQSMADRYTYLPLIGLFVVIAWGGADLAGKLSRQKITAGILAVTGLIVCALLTSVQLQFWQDSRTLYERTLAVTEDNYLACSNMGFLLSREGKMEAAIDYCRKALKIKPRFSVTIFNLGFILESQGRLEEARQEFEDGLQLVPDKVEARVHLARILGLEGKEDEAIEQFTEALQTDPKEFEAHLNLGRLLARKKRLGEAVDQFQTVLSIKPGWPPALKSLGDVFAEQGDVAGALAKYSEALKADPDDAETHSQFAALLSSQHKMTEALVHYREAVRLSPDSPVTLNNLAWVCATDPDPQIRNGAEAVRLAEKACQLTRHEVPVLLGTLAAAYAENRQFTNAVATATQARDLALAKKDQTVADRNAELLRLYQAGKAYHQEEKLAPNDHRN
jgi:Flp pilus assembly protein TadD